MQCTAEHAAVLSRAGERREWSAFLRQRFAESPANSHAAGWQQTLFASQLALAMAAASVDVVGAHVIPIMAQGVFAIFSLLAIWLVHNQLQPHEHAFMNLSASVFYLSSVLLVSCGLLHEVMLHADQDPATLPRLWALEQVMLPIVEWLTFGGAAYLAWGLVTSRRPSQRVTTRRCQDGTCVPVMAELSPLHGRAVAYLKLPSNALAIENIGDAQPRAMLARTGGSVHFPDALVLYRALRPRGSGVEQAAFVETFDAFMSDCNRMDENEQLRCCRPRLENQKHPPICPLCSSCVSPTLATADGLWLADPDFTGSSLTHAQRRTATPGASEWRTRRVTARTRLAATIRTLRGIAGGLVRRRGLGCSPVHGIARWSSALPC